MHAAVLFLASLFVAAAQATDFLGAPCIGSTCDNGLQCITLTGEACSQDAWSLDTSSLCTCGGVGEPPILLITRNINQQFTVAPRPAISAVLENHAPALRAQRSPSGLGTIAHVCEICVPNEKPRYA